MSSDKDWIKCSQSKCPASRFDLRREPFLRYDSYSLVFDDLLDGMRIVCSRVGVLKNSPTPGSFMSSTRQRLCDLLNWLSLQYSAGAPVDLISAEWPYVMSWMEEYATCNEAFDQSSEAGGHMTPHAALRTEDYWVIALRLVCFGLLTGNGKDMPRVMRFLDYCNDDMGVRDGLLERLVAPFVSGRGYMPNTAIRHLPYRKLFKVFDSVPEDRPALMTKYLGEWYHASRREPYIDQHDDGVRSDFCFYGYWSWEAAAVTWLLDIDDSSYRDMSFYPRDLVDFGRRIPNVVQPPFMPPRE